MSGHFGGSSLQTPPGNPVFVNLPLDYTCRICHSVVREALQTSCGHRICEGCVPTMFDGKAEPIICPANEEDCELQTRTGLIADRSARREVRKLMVFCTNQGYGCDWQGTWKDLEPHELQCEYKPVDCQFKEHGCTVLMPLKHKEAHETSQCEFRPAPCQYCNMMVPRVKHEEHHRSECEAIQNPCPWNCGSQPMIRQELQRHFETCPNRPVECKFKNAGCEFVGTVKEATEHSLNEVHKHLELSTIYMAKVELTTVEIRRQLQEMRSERDSSLQSYHNAAGDLDHLRGQIERLGSSNKETKVKMVSLTERIIHLERRVEDVAKKSDVDRHEKDVRALQTSMTQVRSQVTQLERGGTVNRPATAATGSENADLTRRLDVHDTQFAQLDVQMAELDLRFQIVESTSFDGKLLWKLRDFSRRKQEAISGKTLSLYSQPFYTNRFGYKMCARVYLNGDGMGKGTHMSLFFVIMKGEYDALLPWPFQQKVTMILLDQDSGQTNLSDSFRPDPTSSSFKRPTSDMNIASGCPLFVQHNVLETPRFVKDDVMYLKFIVDLSNLNHP